jgi:cystathionine beta-lyase/cystathionine gamma-synthase
MQPVYLTSTYRRPGLDRPWPYDYGRTINPTRSALERQLARLEGGVDARVFASGMAAIDTVFRLLRPKDHVVATEAVYGGTYRLVEGLLREGGLDVTWIDTGDARAVRAALRPSTRLIYVETPTNPTLRLTDLAAVGALARRQRGLRLVVDNTFMTPCLQQPIRFGAHLVVHSTTKYLNGHSDSVGGAVIAARRADAERLAWLQKSAGAILSPLDAFLVLRGIKTLALRMERHEANARAVARTLATHRAVKRLYYPGSPAHPDHRLARRQMRGFGGMIAIDLGSRAAARRFLGRLRLFTLAESLGGVESLAAHPATMTHASVPRAERERLGVTDGLVRLSVGIEDATDLIADLEHALA